MPPVQNGLLKEVNRMVSMIVACTLQHTGDAECLFFCLRYPSLTNLKIFLALAGEVMS